jgi:hypothetical protein
MRQVTIFAPCLALALTTGCLRQVAELVGDDGDRREDSGIDARAVDAGDDGGLVLNPGGCDLQITPSPLNFGAVKAGTTATRTLTVTNVGPLECLIANLSMPSDCAPTFSLPAGPINSQRLAPTGSDGGFPASLVIGVAFTPPSVSEPCDALAPPCIFSCWFLGVRLFGTGVN